jgi:hypothetical protein
MFHLGQFVLLKMLRSDGSAESATCNTGRVIAKVDPDLNSVRRPIKYHVLHNDSLGDIQTQTILTCSQLLYVELYPMGDQLLQLSLG